MLHVNRSDRGFTSVPSFTALLKKQTNKKIMNNFKRKYTYLVVKTLVRGTNCKEGMNPEKTITFHMKSKETHLTFPK